MSQAQLLSRLGLNFNNAGTWSLTALPARYAFSATGLRRRGSVAVLSFSMISVDVLLGDAQPVGAFVAGHELAYSTRKQKAELWGRGKCGQ